MGARTQHSMCEMVSVVSLTHCLYICNPRRQMLITVRRRHSSNCGYGCRLRAPVRSVRLVRLRVRCRGRRLRPVRVDEGLGHVLRRERRLWNYGRSLRVRRPVLDRVRHEDGGAQHGSVRRGELVWAVLQGHLRLQGGPQMVQERCVGDRHGHQLLPPELCAPKRQRRLVQPAAAALRHGSAGVGEDRHLQRRNRARDVPKGRVQEARRGEVYYKRPRLLRARPRDQRRRRRVDPVHVRQGLQDRVAADVQKLGRELAVQRVPQRPVPLFPSHDDRRPDLGVPRHRSGELGVWPDLLQPSAVHMITLPPAPSPSSSSSESLKTLVGRGMLQIFATELPAILAKICAMHGALGQWPPFSSC